MEKNYSDYLKYIESSLTESHILESTAIAKPLGKFRLRPDNSWEPLRYPGFTLITPTFENDSENNEAMLKLCACQRDLSKISPGKIVPAPNSAFHMTIARLISANVFEAAFIKNRQEAAFFEAFNKLFNEADINGALDMRIRGVSIFPQGVVAALVEPANNEVYTRLQAFRDLIYENEALKTIGVERKRGFLGHITLLYIENELSSMERVHLSKSIVRVNRLHIDAPLDYRITRAEVRRFDDFSRFYRNADWPVFLFE